ncbi:MAG TPA: energy transducer TonB [Luteolibacter sp.]|nr:energy transducer TonB [Luteolibacter sp.]
MGSRLSPLPADASAADWLAAHREPTPPRRQAASRPVGLTLPRPHGFADVRMRLSVHPLQIGTLALWLTAAGAGLCGLIFEGWHKSREVTVAHGPSVVMAELTASDAGGEATQPAAEGAASALPLPVESAFEPPPQLVENVSLKPLPDLPPMPAALATRPSASGPSTPSGSAAPQPATTSVARSGQPPARPSGGAAAVSGSGGGMSLAARLAAGSMPAAYPPEARRRGQEGTVMIEFTIGESGRVTGASILKASPWPLLNAAALQAVRGWKFPPGQAVRMQRPIVYQLR